VYKIADFNPEIQDQKGKIRAVIFPKRKQLLPELLLTKGENRNNVLAVEFQTLFRVQC